MSMKNSSVTIRNRFRDLPFCSAVPRPLRPPGAPTEMSTRNISWGQRSPVRRADNLTTFMCWLSWNEEVSTSWNPQGLSRPVQGLLYLFTCDLSAVTQWNVDQRVTLCNFSRTRTRGMTLNHIYVRIPHSDRTSERDAKIRDTAVGSMLRQRRTRNRICFYSIPTGCTVLYALSLSFFFD
jgi:hypothetical protein